MPRLIKHSKIAVAEPSEESGNNSLTTPSVSQVQESVASILLHPRKMKMEQRESLFRRALRESGET